MNNGLDITLEMFNLRNNGESFATIGEKYGITKQAVQQRLKNRFGHQLTTKEYIAMKCCRTTQRGAKGAQDD